MSCSRRLGDANGPESRFSRAKAHDLSRNGVAHLSGTYAQDSRGIILAYRRWRGAFNRVPSQTSRA